MHFQVKESMNNIETVVRERNRAYHYLETGESGEQPTAKVVDELRYCSIEFFHKSKKD